MNNAFVSAIILSFLLMSTAGFAACFAPANGTSVVMNSSYAVLCTDYYENVHITVNDSLITLDCNSSTLNGTDDAGTGITINNNNTVDIIDCTIEDYQTGISITDADTIGIYSNQFFSNAMYDINTYRVTNLEVETNAMYDGASSIRLDDTTTDTIINDNLIQNFTDYGIVVTADDVAISITNNDIIDIGVPGGGYCVANTGGEDLYIFNNTFDSCGHGIDSTGMLNISIADNDFTLNVAWGMELAASVENTSVMTVTGNNVSGSGLGCIYIFGATTDTLIDGNELMDCGNLVDNPALMLYGSNDIIVNNNNIHNNHFGGIDIDTLFDSSIEDNDINGNGDNGIDVTGNSTYISIYHNDIWNNTNSGIYANLIPLTYSNITYNTIYDNGDGIDIVCNGEQLFDRLTSNFVNNSAAYGISVDDCSNVTISSNNASYNGNDGLYVFGLSINTIGGRYCNNSATFDVTDGGLTTTFTGVFCDTDSPDGTCDYNCTYTPPANPSCTATTAANRAAFEFAFLLFAICLAVIPLLGGVDILNLPFLMAYVGALIVIAVFLPALFTMLC